MQVRENQHRRIIPAVRHSPRIVWNSYEGAISDRNIVVSPSTIFAHEADHAISYLTDARAHSDRKNRLRDDSYDNDEEYRVITGSEQLMARANGEITGNQVTRNSHRHNRVITIGVTSNVVDENATRYYKKHVNGW